MKAKIVSIVGVFVLLAISAIAVFAAEEKTVQPTFEEAAQGYVTTLGTCNYFCSKCLPIGHNGACTSLKSCC